MGEGSVNETGDELSLGVFDLEKPKVSEPTADITDVGDWFSCSKTDIFGDKDLLGISESELSLASLLATLRG